MRQFLPIILMILLAITSCSKLERPKTPEARQAMRTRTTEIPIDSAFSHKAVGTAFDVFGDISLKMLISDLKNTEIDTITDASSNQRWINKFKSIDENHSEGYQPGLTLYFVIVLAVFIIILIIKGIRTFIIKE